MSPQLEITDRPSDLSPGTPTMVIDHIGIVVKSIEDGIRQWQDVFGYVHNSSIVTNTRQQVKVTFLSKKDSVTIKLIEPAQAGSPVSLLAQRGGGLHHICFRCDDVEMQIPVLQEKGARLLVPPQPGEAFRGNPIAFLYLNNLNIELIDTAEKEGCLGPG